MQGCITIVWHYNVESVSDLFFCVMLQRWYYNINKHVDINDILFSCTILKLLYVVHVHTSTIATRTYLDKIVKLRPNQKCFGTTSNFMALLQVQVESKFSDLFCIVDGTVTLSHRCQQDTVCILNKSVKVVVIVTIVKKQLRNCENQACFDLNDTNLQTECQIGTICDVKNQGHLKL